MVGAPLGHKIACPALALPVPVSPGRTMACTDKMSTVRQKPAQENGQLRLDRQRHRGGVDCRFLKADIRVVLENSLESSSVHVDG